MEIELPEPDGFLEHGLIGTFLSYTPTASNPQEALYTEAKVRQAIAAAVAKEREACANFLQELEAMLEAVGAGGVSAQRVTQGKGHIEQDLKTVAAPVCETDAQEPVAWRYQTSTGWHATTDASAALRISKHHAIEPMYTAPQPQADGRDAQRYRWLIDYFISDRVDLDDAIVAAKTSEDIAKIIDAAIAKATGRADSVDGSQKVTP